MKPLLLLLFVFAFCYGCKHAVAEGPLFQIVENDRIGFIDTTGKVVILPVFRVAGEFAEGLAEVRKDGTYGYIDHTGDFVIPPQFNYALPFSGGVALVYKDSVSFVIDKTGKKVEYRPFRRVDFFENGRSRVQTHSGKFGCINPEGKLVIDTVFQYIGSFVNGFARVYGLNDDAVDSASNKAIYEAGVIDTLGHFIIPYGRYKWMNDY